MNYRDPKYSKGQVERLARAYHRKFYGAVGSSLTVEDLEQEFWITWMSVRDSFDPAKGFSFEAFLGISIRNRMMELARRNSKRSVVWAKSANEPIDEDIGVCLVDTIEDEHARPDDVLIKRQTREYLLKGIDPRLRLMVDLLADTPAELEKEVVAAQAKASFAASRGISMRSPKELTLPMISEIMGVGRCARYRMIENMQEIAGDE